MTSFCHISMYGRMKVFGGLRQNGNSWFITKVQSSFPLWKRIVMSSKSGHRMGLYGYSSYIYIIKSSLTKAGLKRKFFVSIRIKMLPILCYPIVLSSEKSIGMLQVLCTRGIWNFSKTSSFYWWYNTYCWNISYSIYTLP